MKEDIKHGNAREGDSSNFDCKKLNGSDDEESSLGLLWKIWSDKLIRVEDDVRDIKLELSDVLTQVMGLRSDVRHISIMLFGQACDQSLCLSNGLPVLGQCVPGLNENLYSAIKCKTNDTPKFKLESNYNCSSSCTATDSVIPNLDANMTSGHKNQDIVRDNDNPGLSATDDKNGIKLEFDNASCKNSIADVNTKNKGCLEIEKNKKGVTSTPTIESNLEKRLKTTSEAGNKNKTKLYASGPFILSKAFSITLHDDILNYIFDESLDWSETIVKSKNNIISRYEMLSLRPDSNLTGVVINVVVEFLTEIERTLTANQPNTWYLPTRMTSQSVGNNRSVSDFVEKHRIVDNFMGKLENCQKIYVPIHTGDHWLLLIVRVHDRVVEIWDSMLHEGRSTGYPFVADVLKNLDMVLHDQIKSKMRPSWSFQSFKIETLEFVPQQPNSYDCGVFVIKFMELKSLEDFKRDSYCSQEERAKVVLRIVLSASNLNLSTLRLGAIAYSKHFSTSQAIAPRHGLPQLEKDIRFDEDTYSKRPRFDE